MADTTGQIDQHREAANGVVDSFFSSIEDALRLDIGTLWSHHNGRRFAGYAPVLATLGSVLAGSTNYAELESRLSAAGHETAWSVVEDVCDAVFEREQSKVSGPLASRCSGAVPSNAYDRTEQVRALMAKVTKAPVESALRVSFSNPSDTNIYRQVVAAFVSEHPFLHEGRISSDILGSVLFAFAIHNGLSVAGAEGELEGLSRQPFLWRSFERNTPAKHKVSGLVIGALISSLRADERPELVCVEPSPDPETYALRLGVEGSVVANFTSPLVLGDGLSNARITCDDIRLNGSGASTPSVRLRGPLEIAAGTLTVAASEVVLSGSIWLSADVFIPAGPVRVERSGNGSTRLGFGGTLASSHPWSGLPTELVCSPFSDDAHADPLINFLQTCSDHLPAGAPIVLNLDLSPTDDARVRWATREYGGVFEGMVSLMIAHDLATSERFAASGAAKRRIRFPKSWDALIQSVMTGDPEVQEFADAARELLKA